MDVPGVDLAFLAAQLEANPADGLVRLNLAENGSLVAEWVSGGTPCRTGPAETLPLP